MTYRVNESTVVKKLVMVENAYGIQPVWRGYRRLLQPQRAFAWSERSMGRYLDNPRLIHT
jgi:hypothetical protein